MEITLRKYISRIQWVALDYARSKQLISAKGRRKYASNSPSLISASYSATGSPFYTAVGLTQLQIGHLQYGYVSTGINPFWHVQTVAGQ